MTKVLGTLALLLFGFVGTRLIDLRIAEELRGKTKEPVAVGLGCQFTFVGFVIWLLVALYDSDP